MAKSEGKIFEEDFINSVPENIFHFRFRDLPYFLTKGNKYPVLPNPADFLIFNNYLYVLELKSTKLSSYPLKNTRENQVEGLLKYSEKDKVICGFVINMRKYEETYFLHIDDYILLSKNCKSISIDKLRIYGKFIPQIKKITRYRYNLDKLFEISC